VGDPEGITIYKKNSTEGYVILSSQGNSTFNIYNRIFPYNFINSFTVEGNEYIDSTSDTDGLDVVNINLGEDFPSGLLVIQDGNNEGKNLINKQNFKFISIKDVLDNL
jgi:myo-inositol-hexaphosphate 3-phosphohydrolase